MICGPSCSRPPQRAEKPPGRTKGSDPAVVVPSPASDALANHDFGGTLAGSSPEALSAPLASEWTTVKVRSGQNLASIFTAMGLPTEEMAEVLRELLESHFPPV